MLRTFRHAAIRPRNFGVYEPRLLVDTFAGSGALSAHTPDFCIPGASWSIKAGTFGNLTGGYLPYTSGNNGLALINLGTTEFELDMSYYLGPELTSVGIAFWASADGSTKTTWYRRTTYDLPASNNYWMRVYSTKGLYRTWDSTDGVTYTLATDSYNTAPNAALTYAGLYCYYAAFSGKWFDITINKLSGWKDICWIGDSITANGGSFSFLVPQVYNSGKCYGYHRAAGGATVDTDFATFVTAAASDDANLIVVELGTNGGGTQSIYYNNLVQLHGDHPSAKIYCMDILPKVSGGWAGGSTAFIIGAVAQAVAAGIDCTHWDTLNWIDPTIGVDTDDGLHPNASGNAKIKTQILALLP